MWATVSSMTFNQSGMGNTEEARNVTSSEVIGDFIFNVLFYLRVGEAQRYRDTQRYRV